MLTDLKCRTSKPALKSYKLADSGSLYLLVKPTGGKLWQQNYQYLGKSKTLSHGPYPLVTLDMARTKRDEAKRLLLSGIDPAAQKKKARVEAVYSAQNTFKDVALEWHANQANCWSEGHALNVMRRMESDIFPYLGPRPVSEITAPELLTVLRRVEARGAIDIAHRVKQTCGQIFRYGIATGRGQRDHAADLKQALKMPKNEHYASLDIKELPEFLRRLDKNEARLFPRTLRAVKLLMLTFVRTSELIEATWDEIDFDACVWNIPASRMKMKKPHVVPLCRQAIDLLRSQKEETERFSVNWIFPSQRRPIDHMSNNTILTAIKSLGYKGKMTGHGFRSLAMTAIKEKLGYRHEVIDRQLAHAHRNKVAAAYDRAMFMDERTVMMQRWANYIDDLRAQNRSVNVVIPNINKVFFLEPNSSSRSLNLTDSALKDIARLEKQIYSQDLNSYEGMVMNSKNTLTSFSEDD
ncbi:MAG: tyrosine-type recombinase/integrase [Micavibrio sp.]|nr:tyrosine-type recombinase/integrase [Micavibrio sp.]